ncbi:MAG: M20/M25/M40 family metallo-hydrolase, partial [Thermoanaerobaculia bacterium]
MKSIVVLCLLVATSAIAAPPPLDAKTKQLAFDIYKELIEINTPNSVGNNTTAAEAMAARLKAAGFPAADVQVLAPDPRKGNLVARLHGTGKEKPLLLLAHLDVVEAKREDWSMDPFVLTEKDGYYYGRGTSDDKAMAAIWIATMIRFKNEGFVPNRDVIVALTSDEETGDFNGVSWLLKEHRDLIDAAFALNEGGSGRLKDGKRLYNGVSASEKVYVTFGLETRNKGGHSSAPRKDNAIYELANG